MALLQLISLDLEEVKSNENLIRISEFNKLISELIQDEEAPFIYERIGTRFQHFLLDEFQDTSRLQWLNIVPLIHESLSQNKENLIVGDPKQSIYRFKNGIAEQFVALPEIYNPENDSNIKVKSDYFYSQGEKKSLLENWRSCKNIVEFNNSFFTTLKDTIIPNEFHSFYEDVKQIPKGNEGGFVYIHSEKIEKSDDEEAESSTNLMLEWVDSCLKDGFDAGDICILGYEKKECNEWARELTSKGYKVVSTDSLLVNSDYFVRLTIAYLKCRKNPIGELELRRFSELYFSSKETNSIVKIQSYWKIKSNSEGKEFQVFDSEKFFKEHFKSEEHFFFSYQNLFDLLQGFYKLAGLNEIENPYLHHLSDMAHEFDVKYGPELDLFLEEYEQSGKKSPIQSPENKQTIKIMTAHKSKGLEFPIVIVPSMDWTISKTQNPFLISEEDEFMYENLSENSPIKSISLKSKEEKKQNLLDKINLCYVVFTRPVERLYVANLCGNRGNKFGTEFHKALEKTTELSKIEGDKIIVEYGETSQKEKNLKNELLVEENNFKPLSLNDTLWFPEISIQDHAFDEEFGLSEQRRYGTQLHFLVSILKNKSEIESIVSAKTVTGEIEAKFSKKLKEDLDLIFNFSAYSNLLDGATSILNEQAIIIDEKSTKVPDKIIIKENETIVLDFKTGDKSPKHQKQVQQYVSLLKKMNYPNVKGLVFYTKELDLQEV
jgi:ATP-dependent exoDNAse (exonuclease V) beta subunit